MDGAPGSTYDWEALPAYYRTRFDGIAHRLTDHLRLLESRFYGRDVDRLEHCLQSATLAAKANRNDEYVACALLHDVGDTLGPADHGAVAAAIVEPFVSADLHWIVANHTRFQARHSFDRTGMRADASDDLAGSPWFDAAAEFCAEFDWPAFQKGYPSLRLEHFTPLL